MRLLPGLLILLAFPVLEIWLLAELGDQYGGWVLLYLLIIGILGWRLIKDEKFSLAGRMMESLSQGGTPGRAMLMSLKNLAAGLLLLIPGVITDVIAVILLLMPATGTRPRQQSGNQRRGRAANDDIIEGEYRRED
jgi:UPF0716 protein FxsA